MSVPVACGLHYSPSGAAELRPTCAAVASATTSSASRLPAVRGPSAAALRPACMLSCHADARPRRLRTTRWAVLPGRSTRRPAPTSPSLGRLPNTYNANRSPIIHLRSLLNLQSAGADLTHTRRCSEIIDGWLLEDRNDNILGCDRYLAPKSHCLSASACTSGATQNEVSGRSRRAAWQVRVRSGGRQPTSKGTTDEAAVSGNDQQWRRSLIGPRISSSAAATANNQHLRLNTEQSGATPAELRTMKIKGEHCTPLRRRRHQCDAGPESRAPCDGCCRALACFWNRLECFMIELPLYRIHPVRIIIRRRQLSTGDDITLSSGRRNSLCCGLQRLSAVG